MKDDYNLDELNAIDVRGMKFNIMPRYTYHYIDNDYEQFSLDLLDILVGDKTTAIDIGAHYGIYSLLAAKKANQVFAFEPVPENYKILQKNISDNQLEKVIVPINKAVSDTKGSVDFNVTWASDSAGFYIHPNAEVIRRIKVEMCAVDEELTDVRDVSFIKIDTEGHEIHVLDGLKKTLKNNKHARMLIEFNPECLINAGNVPLDLIRKIHSLGYDIFAVHENTRSLTKVEADTTEAEILQGLTYLNLLCLPTNEWHSALFVCHNASIGGAELALYETTKALVENTGKLFIPTVVFPGNGSLVEKFKKLPIPIVVLPMRWWANNGALTDEESRQVGVIRTNAIAELSKIVATFKPQVVMTNTLVTPWGAFVARAFGVPHVWSIHEFGDLDHQLEFDYGYEESLRMVDEFSSTVLVNSLAVKKHVSRYISPSKIRHQYLTFVKPELSAKAPKPVYGSQAKLKLLISGRVMPTKGQLDAIKATHELRQQGHRAELIVLGAEGPEEYIKEIKDFIKKHDLQKVVHLVGHKDKPFDYVNMADIVLVASNNEAFGRVTVEAMLLGKPVVGSNSGGTTEIIKDGTTGLLYKPNDVADLVKMIKKIAKPEQFKKMGSAAKKDAEQRFYNDYYDYIYDILTSQKTGKPALHGVYKDLLVGLYQQHEQQRHDFERAEEIKRQELQNFSDEYNKVYEAYNVVSAELQKLQSYEIVKFRNKIGHLRHRKDVQGEDKS